MNKSKLIRTQRYESRIANFLNEFISKEIYNSALKFAKITYVWLSNDYMTLKVYVDCLDRTEIDHLIVKLNANKGVFRKQLAMEFNFKKAPEIFFFKDQTIDRVQEVEEILNNLKK